MLHTMAPFFILSSWSLVTTFLFPVETPQSITSYQRHIRKAIKMGTGISPEAWLKVQLPVHVMMTST